MKIPRGLTVILGVPGSGKTTLAAYFARRARKERAFKKRNVFSNVPIIGTLKIEPRTDFGKYLIEDGMVLVDEAGIEFNNRQFKSLPHNVIEFAKYYRHYGIKAFVFFSQSLDMDVTFQRLADRVMIVKKSVFPYFIATREVRKYIGIDNQTHQLVDQYEWTPLSRRWVFAPPNWKYFDTYDSPPLEVKQFETWGKTTRWEDVAKKCKVPLDKSKNDEISILQEMEKAYIKYFDERKTPLAETLAITAMWRFYNY